MAKRKNGEGTVRKRVDGRWEGRYSYTDFYGDDKTKYFTAKTKKDCIKKIKQFRLEIEEITNAQNGLPYVVTPDIILEKWADIWLEYYCKNRIRETTYDRYKLDMDLYILPRLGQMPINALTASICQSAILDIRDNGRCADTYKKDKPLAYRTIDTIKMELNSCLQVAVDEQIIPNNPVAHIKLQKEPKKEMKTIQSDDLERFLEETKRHGCYEFYFLELSTGLRLGEILALTWDDLDPYNKTISVNKQVQRVKGELKVMPPKTDNSIRTIKISQRCVDLLMNLKKITPKKNNLMFPSPNCNYQSSSCIVTKLHRMQDNIGLEHIRFHDLRHTFATLSIELGMDIKTISHMLGHTNAGFTMNTYMHATEKMQDKVANTMSNLLIESTKSENKVIKLSDYMGDKNGD